MGQVQTPPSRQDIILTSVDRLQSSNSGGGIPVGVQHVIFLGANAGANETASDVIALGANAYDGGMADAAGGQGSIAIGSGALSSLTSSGSFGLNGPNVAIGYRCAEDLTIGGRNVFVGPLCMANYPAGSGGAQVTRNVAIGFNVMGASTDPNNLLDCVLIGANVIGNSASTRAMNSVVIGSLACENSAGGGIPVTGSVVVGNLAAQSDTPNNDVIIGANCAQGKIAGGSNVFIGQGVSAQTNSANVAIGGSADVLNANDSVVIGFQTVYRGSRAIILGRGAGNGEAATADRLIVETQLAGTQRAMFFGDMATGCLTIGNSLTGVNREFHGTNTLKLLNGTKDAVNPTAGGYFYVTAGALHWVGSAGTDTAIAPA